MENQVFDLGQKCFQLYKEGYALIQHEVDITHGLKELGQRLVVERRREAISSIDSYIKMRKKDLIREIDKYLIAASGELESLSEMERMIAVMSAECDEMEKHLPEGQKVRRPGQAAITNDNFDRKRETKA